MIDIHGVPPLSLRWLKIINGRRRQFLVEGIEGGHVHEDLHVPRSAHDIGPENRDSWDGALTQRAGLPKL